MVNVDVRDNDNLEEDRILIESKPGFRQKLPDNIEVLHNSRNNALNAGPVGVIPNNNSVISQYGSQIYAIKTMY